MEIIKSVYHHLQAAGILNAREPSPVSFSDIVG
jgi:hypothetical protein